MSWFDITVIRFAVDELCQALTLANPVCFFNKRTQSFVDLDDKCLFELSEQCLLLKLVNRALTPVN